jgi:glycosyltransferase involved in cell wall biosynthesis
VLVPCFNEWESVELVIQELDSCLAGQKRAIRVLLVDDCSTISLPAGFLSNARLSAIASVTVLRLRRNLGHQRAICVGLSHVYEHGDCDAVVVMDGDGEDRPQDVPRLLERMDQHGGSQIVFAERRRRSESLVFRTGYFAYRVLHRLLTGIPVKVGNFSVVPRAHLASLSVISEMWSHYAAAVFKARIPRDSVPTERGKRLRGESKLNFAGLVLHGLSAIAVFSEVVGIRLSLAAGVMVGGFLVLSLVVVVMKLATNLAIPGWATSALGLLLVLMFQGLIFIVSLTSLLLFNRNNMSFIPVRDYKLFVDETRLVKGSDA